MSVFALINPAITPGGFCASRVLAGKHLGGGGRCDGCGIEADSGLVLHRGAQLCPACDMSLHIDFAGKAQAGTMIFAPRLTQAKVNLLSIAIFVSVLSDNKEIQEIGKSTYAKLKWLSGALNSSIADPGMSATWKERISDPLWFAGAAHVAGKTEVNLQRVRFLPKLAPLSSWLKQSGLAGNKACVNDNLVAEMIKFESGNA